MRVAIVNAQVPFVRGGAEVLAEGLLAAIAASGHEVDLVRIPFKWYPPQAILDGIVGSRMLDLSSANGKEIDKIITLKFPSYLTPHPNKTLWLVHQHRSAYDMWDTGNSDLNAHPLGGIMREAIKTADKSWITEHKSIFTISKNVQDRLQRDVTCDAEVLYPPVSDAIDLSPLTYEDFFLLPSRINSSKRQHIFLEALAYCKSRPKIIVAGAIEDAEYHANIVKSLALSGRDKDVKFIGMVSRTKLIDLYNNCRAVLFSPHDEDYGYVTLEAFYAGKPVITSFDSGGPLEFVVDRENGIVTGIDNKSVSNAMDELWVDINAARRMGSAAFDHINGLNITWNNTVDKLLFQ